MKTMQAFDTKTEKNPIEIFEENYKNYPDMKIDYERKYTHVKAVQLKELDGYNILKCMMFCGNAKPLNSFDEIHFEDYVNFVKENGYLKLVINNMQMNMNVGDYLVWDRIKYRILTKEQFEMSFMMEKDIKEIMYEIQTPINIGIKNVINNYKNGTTEFTLNDIFKVLKHSLDMRYINSDEYYKFCEMLLDANLKRL